MWELPFSHHLVAQERGLASFPGFPKPGNEAKQGKIQESFGLKLYVFPGIPRLNRQD